MPYSFMINRYGRLTQLQLKVQLSWGWYLTWSSQRILWLLPLLTHAIGLWYSQIPNHYCQQYRWTSFLDFIGLANNISNGNRTEWSPVGICNSYSYNLWARGQLRINFMCILKVFTKLPESRSDEGNLENFENTSEINP